MSLAASCDRPASESDPVPTGGQRQHERSYHDEAKGLEGMIQRYKMRVHVSPFLYATVRGIMMPWERNSPSTRTVPAM